MDVFEEDYEEGMTMEDAVLLGLKALTKATEDKLSTQAVEIGVVRSDENFRKLTEAEVDAYVKKLGG
jgi:proteasome alpha subunit